MSFDYQMCMLSNTPIHNNTKVKLYFLIAEGVYKQPLFKEKIFYPWDTSKILGGVSLNATYTEDNEFKIKDDEKSRYILSLLRKDQNDENLTFETIFEQLVTGHIKINKTTNENAYLNIGLVHEDIYKHMIKFAKKKALPMLKKQFAEHIKFRDVESKEICKSTPSEKYEEDKDYINVLRVGFIQEYIFSFLSVDGKNPFAYFKKEYALTDNDAFDLLVEDMLLIHIMYECSMSLNPRSLNDVHSDRSLRKELFLFAHEKLYNDEDSEMIKPKFSVKVTQEISYSALAKVFNKQCFKEELNALKEFRSEHYELNEVRLSGAKEINSYIFLRDVITQTDVDLIIKLD